MGGFRVLIYSHDSFGLGHIRRCRTIAQFLVRQFADLRVRILSGSPMVGEFEFSPGVDYWRLPQVIKLKNGDYVSGENRTDLKSILKQRSRQIRETIVRFQPHLFVADKEPLGIQGEVKEGLQILQTLKVPKILGLRDVMDEPEALCREWSRKKVFPALENVYNEIWVYGLREIYDPFVSIPVGTQIQRKIHYTGYLYREERTEATKSTESRFLLMTGGGGDGEGLVDWVLRAYEQDSTLAPIVMLLGPFMPAHFQTEFKRRAGCFPQIEIVEFASHPETLIRQARGVIAMGGYNTFCEILSFNKPALIIPRERPRQEQFLRISNASKLGLCTMLHDDGRRDPTQMRQALKALETQPPPLLSCFPRLLNGLDYLKERCEHWLFARQSKRTLNESYL